MKTETLAYFGAIAIILALIVSVVALLIAHTLTLEQIGPFLTMLIVPLTAIAGLPIFKAALAAPSPEQAQQIQQQSAQLHTTLTQAVQSLAQAAQPAQVPPAPIAPAQPVQPAQVAQQPFPPLTVPMAAMPKQ